MWWFVTFVSKISGPIILANFAIEHRDFVVENCKSESLGKSLVKREYLLVDTAYTILIFLIAYRREKNFQNNGKYPWFASCFRLLLPALLFQIC